jgi:hypothetical protein
LTRVVDIGANPVDGAPPYKPLLDAQLCRLTGFEPQPVALAELNRKKGTNKSPPYRASILLSANAALQTVDRRITLRLLLIL